MKIVKWTVACAFFYISTATPASNVDGIIVSHYEPLQRLDYRRDGIAVSQKLNTAGPVTMSFDALGNSFELQLDPNTRLLSPAARAELADGVALYRGHIAGKTDSWARITIVDGMPSGLIWDGSQMYAIETPGDSVLNTDKPIIYRLADSFIAPGTMSCGDVVISGNGAETFKSLVGELRSAKGQGPGAVTEINFGAIGDFEFSGPVGSGAAAEIIARLNNVDGIFSQQLGVQITVRTLETFAAAADPFTDTADAGALLDELATYRLNSQAQRNEGLTHLFTGRDLDTTTVGIAFSGELCQTRFGAGLTQGTHGQTVDSLIAAHEIGHNFGAPHDGVVNSPCVAESQTFLMAPSINNSNQFSDCSIAEMQDDIALASCITPLPSVDVSVASGGQPAPVLLGNAVTVSFDVSNNGTIAATNVAADVTLPNNVSFLSSGVTTGSCTNGAGSVNCLLGDIAAGSSSTVIVTSTTTAAGTGMFNATVSADADGNPGNNQEIVQVTVEPAVNLIINPPAAVQVTVDQSTTISAMLENQSILNATGVSLSISLDSGLRADSASWPIGTCSVAAQQVDCQTDNFAAQSSTTLDVNVSGITSGLKNYTLTISSNEADADQSDNTVSGAVTVNSVAGGGDDSGGGAADLIALWLLGWMVLFTRRRSQRS